MKEFYPMLELPEKSVDEPNFSKTVIVYDLTGDDTIFSNHGYYNFQDLEWVHFGDDSMHLICWCYIPDPKEFIEKNDLEITLHKGFVH